MNDHIAGEDLSAYVDGMLAGRKKAELESHLSRCSGCLEALSEILDIQRSRKKVPGEFLRRALKVPGEGALGDKQGVLKPHLSMRMVFGIAAVFMVAALLGFFFLSHNRFWQAEKIQKEPSDQVVAGPASQAPPEDEKLPFAPAGNAEPARERKEEKGSVKKKGAYEPSAVPPSEKKMERMVDEVAVKDTKQARTDDETMLAETSKQEESAPLAAGLEMDKANEVKTADLSSAEVTSRTVTARPTVAGKAQAAQPARVGEANELQALRPDEHKTSGKKSLRSRPEGVISPSGATQLFLAVSGRASASLGLVITAQKPTPRLYIQGDVGWTDLLNPELLDEWSWFPVGPALELAIAPDGSVSAVTLVGKWDRREAEQAGKEAKKLVFSISGKKSRRGVLTMPEAPPN
jgi:hypothetical protein